MFVTVNNADPRKEPSTIAIDTVAEYRPFALASGDNKFQPKTIVIFKKSEDKKDLFSSDSIDELHKKFNHKI